MDLFEKFFNGCFDVIGFECFGNGVAEFLQINVAFMCFTVCAVSFCSFIFFAVNGDDFINLVQMFGRLSSNSYLFNFVYSFDRID